MCIRDSNETANFVTTGIRTNFALHRQPNVMDIRGSESRDAAVALPLRLLLLLIMMMMLRGGSSTSTAGASGGIPEGGAETAQKLVVVGHIIKCSANETRSI